LLIVTFDGLSFTIDERLTLAVATLRQPFKKKFPYIGVHQATTTEESLKRLKELGFRLLNSAHVHIVENPIPPEQETDPYSQTFLSPSAPHAL
jgi:hypothetical protein